MSTTLSNSTALTPVNKRRLITSLPVVNRTPDLAAFFGATVDEVFQPGTSEPLNGYIGHTFPNNNDFYIAENSAQRAFYQLEPGMVSFDATDASTINYALTYPDFVSYFDTNGGDVSDHGRMFETDYYAWAPPINVDMLINYRHYYWFGDVNPAAETTYVWNKADKSNGIALLNSNLMAVSQATNNLPTAVRSTPIGAGLWYVEFTITQQTGTQFLGLANQRDALMPTAGISLPGQQSGNNAVICASDGNVFNDQGTNILQAGLDVWPSTMPTVVGVAWSTFSKKVWFRVNTGSWNNAADNPSTGAGGFDISNMLANGPACLLWAGTRNDDGVKINFGTAAFDHAPPTDFVGPANTLASNDLPALTLQVPIALYNGDGSASEFALPSPMLALSTSYEQPTAYINNSAVSGTTLSQDGNSIILPAAPPQGSVVMVCRTPDLAGLLQASPTSTLNVSDINTQGVEFLSSTMRVEIIDTSHMVEAWDTQPWDVTGWDISIDAVYMVDGVGQAIRLTPMSQLVRGLAAQYVTIDRSSLDGNAWSVRNSWVHEDSFAWSGQTFPSRQATRPIIEFIRDIILYAPQTWSENADPLFKLFDLQNHPLNDSAPTGHYPHSTFTGSRIFGYAPGTGPVDLVLRRRLQYDNNGYIVFSNDSANVSATYQTGTPPTSTAITGLFCYATFDGSISYIPFWHQAANTTVQGRTNGLWNIPANLQANPDYDEVDLISRSTWNEHFTSMISNQLGYVGDAAGDTNYRDTRRDLTVGTGILQHHAPLLKTMMLAVSAQFDLLHAIRYAETEYSRFRNKFARKLVDLRNRGVLQDTDQPATWVNQALTALKVGHNNNFPFALSAMGGGQYFIPPTPTGLCIQPAAVPAIVTDTTYGDARQMLLGHDGSLSLLFGDWRDDILLQLETLIYENLPQPPETIDNRITPGNGSFLDNASNIYTLSRTGYVTVQYVGTNTPVTIPNGAGTAAMQYYNNQVYAQDAASGQWFIFDGTQFFTSAPTPPPINSEAGPTFNIQQWIGNRFYQQPYQGYDWFEVNAITAPMFELWAQINHVDYRANSTFDYTDPFSWNYRGVLDAAGNALPGHWRGIFRFYYDTDAPNTRPWEMLGFASQPSWWVGHYGSPPYALSNTQLWLDLEAGLIASGPRAGTDPRYARPGLHNVIPVDLNGNLRDPIATGIVLTTITQDMASRDWIAGDGALAETLWQHSPAYRFALARASFLMKPARFVEECWDALGIGYINGQWVELVSLQRPRNAAQYLHSEIDPSVSASNATPKIGISQWLSDYMLSSGKPITALGAAIRGLNVALIHQMAGFTSIDNVQLVADAFGLLPAEDVKCILYTSPAVDVEVYSGVIIQWTGQSWSVVGFDGRNPSFTIIPPNLTGSKNLISLATAAEPSIVAWHSGTYYPTGILVEYQNSVYECIRSHSSGINFETTFWQPRPDLSTAMIRAPRVIKYNQGLPNSALTVPYGTEFSSYQDVADFLLGYERYLVSRGWIFTNTNANNQVLDWTLAVYEFLTWAQVQWAPGNFIAISPGQKQLNFVAQQGTILNVEDNVTGFYGLIDRSGAPISQREAVVSRLDGEINIAANDADIFLARLEICNIEHALVVSNVTVFNDDVYLPLFDLRQERLRLICNRAYGWAGRLDAPGFIISGNTLASSFEKAATDVQLMFDIEQADVQLLRDYARHNVGMQQRSYLSNLLLSPSDQFEFYQGMVQEKGTPGVFNALARSNLATGNTTLLFLEEWAFRLSTFGAPRDPFITFQLIQSQYRTEPQIVRLVTQPGTPVDWIELSATDTRWYDKPIDATAFFDERTDYAPAVLPTAGPVRLAEITGTCFDFNSVGGMYDPNTYPFVTNSLTWVYNSIPVFEGTMWYVDAFFGNDNNTGLSPQAALQTLQQAHDQCNPGDIITVAAGTYIAAGLGNNVLEITRSGIASAPITFQAATGARPIILGAQSPAAVHFNAVSYIEFDGFEIIGWNSGLVLSDVQSLDPSTALNAPLYNGSGIVIDRGQSASIPHHITVRNCVVHDFPYNGIFANWSDYITIQGCTTYNNGLYSVLAGSGINVLNSHGIDNLSTYKTTIVQNISYNNINKVLNQAQGNITDGCGITIAGNLNDYTDGVSYNGRTLVQNNLVYGNGGIGIQVNDSNHVDVTFNTTYQNQNNTNLPLGEICGHASVDVNIYNNIMVATDTAPLATSSLNTDVTYSNNIGFGGIGLPMPGLTSTTDPLFIDPVNTNNFMLRQGSWALKAANNAAFSADVDLAGDVRNVKTGWDIGCYQRESSKPPLNGVHPYTVLKAFDTGVNNVPNTILAITTAKEDPSVTTMRIAFQQPMNILADDVGNYLVIDGASGASPEVQGVQMITDVHPDTNSVDILTVGTAGSNFLSDLASAPVCRVLRPMRFATLAAINPNYDFNVGDLVWLDQYDQLKQWAVVQWDGSNWNLYRQQPHRVDPTTIAETVIYSAGAQIKGQQMILNEPVVDDVVVIDPLSNLICNLSNRDIDFKTDFDPARYNAGAGTLAANVWGSNEVGRVWWNLATVRFLDTFTDTLGVTPARDLAELEYRGAWWGQLAPSSSVDVYEWTESLVDPNTYASNPTNTGTLYQDGLSWVERTVYDPTQQQDVVKYYFWVAGNTLVPNLPFRHISAAEIALGIENPSALNIAWMGAISRDAIVISGVMASLDETSTVMKIRLASDNSAGHHDEWLLLRPGDETSLPPDFLWAKMRDGLAGFQVNHDSITATPDPTLTAARSIGIDQGQCMFQIADQLIPAWTAGQTYYYGDLVSNQGLSFQCVVAGTAAGLPTLTLNNQLSAVYSSGSGTLSLVFTYNGLFSGALAPISLNMNTGDITDLLGDEMTLNQATVTTSNPFQTVVTFTLTFPKSVTVTVGPGPTGYGDAITDGSVLWAYHGTDQSRGGLLDARQAFVGSVNSILAQTPVKRDRNQLLATMYRKTTYPSADLPYLVWAQLDDSYPYEPPPQNEWTQPYEVYSITQRNDLLATQDFLNAIEAGQPIDVLLSGIASPIPQWSIWRLDPAAASRVWQKYPLLDRATALLENADLIYGLKTAYEYSCVNEDERDQLVTSGQIQDGDRVLVSNDANTGFWSIYRWNAAQLYFDLWRVQTYNTADFIIDANWYDAATLTANGYNVNNPPIITYNTVADRDATEGASPTNLLVNVLNTDTDLNFTWWAYIDGAWQEVAIQNATVQLSPHFYDPLRPVHAVNTLSPPRILTPETGGLVNDSNGDTWTLTSDGSLLENGEVVAGSGLINALTEVAGNIWALSVQTGLWLVYDNGEPFSVSTSQPPPSSNAPPTIGDIGLRDGSWEMYIIAHALRYSGLLLEAELNTLWFDIVNFVHVQQNEVDWAFKTSFMTLAGIAAPMTQTAVQTLDQTADVIAYINEVKPYRVKLRETTTQYVPAQDIGTFHVTDFDNTVYTDPVTGLQRPLDPLNGDDVNILLGSSDPWSAWYANYNLTPSPVRSLTVTMLFDRIVGQTGNWDILGWDVETWDNSESDPGAGYRISTYYQPTGNMPANDLTALLGLAAKENQISDSLVEQSPNNPTNENDGGTFVPETDAVDINPPQTSQPGGYDLRPPYYNAQHPEERVVFGADDNITIKVTAEPLAGGPPQIVKVFDLPNTLPGLTTSLFMDLMPHSATAVMVFCDGVRAVLNTDYTIDYFNRAVILNLTVNSNLVSRAVIHVFSFGGNSAVTEQHFLTYGTNALTLYNATTASNVLAVVNGIPTTNLTVSGTTVSLTSAPANGADVALVVYQGGVSTACTTYVQTFAYTVSQIYTISNPDTQTVPPHAGTIVELNGLRLTPPVTYYGSMNVGTPWMYLPLMPSVTDTVTIWVDDVLYTAAIPIAIGTSATSGYPFGLVLPGAAPSTHIQGQFVLFDNLLVALDPVFISSNVKISIMFSDSPPAYEVSADGTTLTILPPMSSSDVVTVTTFGNAACMGIQTSTYQVGAPVQHIVPVPWSESYCLVTMNGKALVQEDDYVMVKEQFATGDDAYFTANVIQMINPVGAGDVVVTSFTGSAARELMQWLTSSTTPAASRMFLAPIPPAQEYAVGWDAVAFDAQKYDDADLLGVSTNAPANPAALYAIGGRFESIRLSPYMAGTLATDLGIDDATIVINLFIDPLSTKLQDANPLPIPQTSKDQPGAIWIDGERIEYFEYSRSGNVVTLGALRRATRGTSMGAMRVTQAATATGVAQTFSFTGSGVVDVEIDDVGVPPTGFTVAGSTTVTLTANAGSYIVVGLTLSASHLAGAHVHNGKAIFLEDVPLGPPVGNRELMPMHRIITGG